MAKNKLVDLNDHLFAQLERLSDEDITGEQLQDEIRRAGAIDRIAAQVIAVGDLALKATRHQVEWGPAAKAPRLLGLDGDNA